MPARSLQGIDRSQRPRNNNASVHKHWFDKNGRRIMQYVTYTERVLVTSVIDHGLPQHGRAEGPSKEMAAILTANAVGVPAKQVSH